MIGVTTVDGNKTATSTITVTSGGGGNTGSGTVTTKKYTLTFNTDGGFDIAHITQDYGTTVTAPAIIGVTLGVSCCKLILE